MSRQSELDKILQIGVCEGQVDMVRLALKEGANPNALAISGPSFIPEELLGKPIIHHAITSTLSEPEIVISLLEYGAKSLLPTSNDDGTHPFFHAISNVYMREEKLLMLLYRDVDLSKIVFNDYTLLHHLASHASLIPARVMTEILAPKLESLGHWWNTGWDGLYPASRLFSKQALGRWNVYVEDAVAMFSLGMTMDHPATQGETVGQLLEQVPKVDKNKILRRIAMLPKPSDIKTVPLALPMDHLKPAPTKSFAAGSALLQPVANKAIENQDYELLDFLFGEGYQPDSTDYCRAMLMVDIHNGYAMFNSMMENYNPTSDVVHSVFEFFKQAHISRLKEAFSDSLVPVLDKHGFDWDFSSTQFPFRVDSNASLIKVLTHLFEHHPNAARVITLEHRKHPSLISRLKGLGKNNDDEMVLKHLFKLGIALNDSLEINGEITTVEDYLVEEFPDHAAAWIASCVAIQNESELQNKTRRMRL